MLVESAKRQSGKCAKQDGLVESCKVESAKCAKLDVVGWKVCVETHGRASVRLTRVETHFCVVETFCQNVSNRIMRAEINCNLSRNKNHIINC